MFTLTYFYAEYGASICSWDIWNDDRPKMIALHLFQLTTRFNSLYTYESDIHYELWHINLYMKIGFSNWHIGSIDLTKKWFSTQFQFDTRLLTCMHLKPFSTYFVGQMERWEKRAVQLLKMRKKNITWNIKTKCETDVLLIVRSSSTKDYSWHSMVNT